MDVKLVYILIEFMHNIEILPKDEVEDFGPSNLATYQQILWDTFEKPHKSCLAKYTDP